jgi:hypothetical protein
MTAFALLVLGAPPSVGRVSDLDFDGLLGWLDDRRGREVALSLGGAADGLGNSQLVVHGVLARPAGPPQVTLIDAAPGRVERYEVGDAHLVLLEGDFVAASGLRVGAEEGGEPAHVVADFGELAFTFSCDPATSSGS